MNRGGTSGIPKPSGGAGGMKKPGQGQQQTAPRKQQINTAGLPSDDELFENLQRIFQGQDTGLTLGDLKNPATSRRLFTANGVIYDIIQKAALMEPETAPRTIWTLAEQNFRYSGLHPKFHSSVAFAAAIEAFLSIFEEGLARNWKITVMDILKPDAVKVRVLLNALVGILSVSSQHDAQLLQAYETIREQQKERDILWDKENTVATLERIQEQKEVDEASDIEIARERTTQYDAEMKQLDEKISGFRDLNDKTRRHRDDILKKEIAQKEERKQLLAQLAAVENECVTEDPDALLKRLETVRAEKEKMEEERAMWCERLAALKSSQASLKDGLDTAESIHDRLHKSKKSDHVTFTTLEEELRDKRRTRNAVIDEVGRWENSCQQLRNLVKDREAAFELQNKNITSSRSNEKALQKALDGENKSLEKKCQEISSEKAKLERICTDLGASLMAMDQQKEQMKQDYAQSVAALGAECSAEIESVRLLKDEALRKNAELRERFAESMGRSMDEPEGSAVDRLPIAARGIYVQAQTILRAKHKHPKKWIMPDLTNQPAKENREPLSEPTTDAAADTPNKTAT
ncbi:hypothetical protein BV898_13226 [Hypsibius exemplaris]|uniref:Uncharacterized protein n=1 Tax=Hypsibius exemplaris TaxID=2072580 RepID=A0A1W0WBF4_HYPEX|nr:hypothetical protein BV898_13226 [Hypsibius exemplaris]